MMQATKGRNHPHDERGSRKPARVSPVSPNARDLLTTQDAALLCGVARRTMLRWVESGLIRGHTTPGGRWRIRREDLETFMREQGMGGPTEAAPTGPPRIGIVDDDPAHVDATRRWLEEVLPGAEVRVAYDGFSAGLLVRDHLPHILLLDVLMPGMDGYDVCERIRSDATFDEVAIFAVSSDMNPRRVERLLDLGADRCISKADLIPSLQDATRRLAAGERSLR
jgi:excisionase family DNA binding protein